MQLNKENKYQLDCYTCFNRELDCPCSIFLGNPNLPNLYNKKFPETINRKEIQQIKIKEDIYIFKL